MNKNFKKILSIKNKLNTLKKKHISKKKNIFQANKDLKTDVKYKEQELIAFYLKKKISIQNQLINEQYNLINIAENFKNKINLKLKKKNQFIKKFSDEIIFLKKTNKNYKLTANKYIKYARKIKSKLNNTENVKIDNLSFKKNNSLMKNKINFFREENVRLSKDLNDIKMRYNKIKNKLINNDFEKNNFIKQIKDLKEFITKSKIYLNAPKLAPLNYQKLSNLDKKIEFKNINDEVKHIFKNNN